MKKIAAHWKKILLMSLVLLPMRVSSSVSDVIRLNYDRLVNISNSYKESNEKIIEIQNTYNLNLIFYQAKGRIDHLSDEDLELLYRASNIASFYTDKKLYIEYMKEDVDVMQKRGVANNRHYLDLYGAYISARMFDEARDLLGRHDIRYAEKIPSISVSPRIEGAPRAFFIDKGNDGLRLQSVDVKNGIKIVIVSHPSCHFSRNAVSYIESNNSLKKLFDQYAIWLVPSSRKIEFDLIREWSSIHPGNSTMLAYGREDWSMITSWDTPTFYFFKDGNVVDVVAGWPRQGNEAALWVALRKVGLYPAN